MNSSSSFGRFKLLIQITFNYEAYLQNETKLDLRHAMEERKIEEKNELRSNYALSFYSSSASSSSVQLEFQLL